MRQEAAAYVVDGAAARLNPGAGRSLAAGPGQLGRGGAAAAAVWDAAVGIQGQDLFAGFWREEAGRIDWLKGYLCDPAMVVLFEVLAQPDEEPEEAEELYSKAAMNTLGAVETDYQ